MRSVRKRPVARLVIWLLLIAMSWQPTPSRADAQRAGVLVIPGAGRIPTSTCVAFDEVELAGAELLRRAQVNLLTQVSVVGEAVCKIGETGCAYPGENCFCRCLGAQCAYWSYWYREDSQWVYSGKGGSSRLVRHGDLDAWVWGDGQTPPPAAGWDDVCGSVPLAVAASIAGYQGVVAATPPSERSAAQGSYPAPEHTPTPTESSAPYPGAEPTSTRPPGAVPSPTSGDTPFVRATATARPTATPLPTKTPLQPGDSPMLPQRTTQTTSPAGEQPTTAAQALPTATSIAEHEQPAAAAIGPTSTPGVDTVAARIRQGVAQARATAAARNLSSSQPSRGSYGFFVVLVVVMLTLVGYAVLLRRQRALAIRNAAPQAESAPAPEEPGDLADPPAPSDKAQ